MSCSCNRSRAYEAAIGIAEEAIDFITDNGEFCEFCTSSGEGCNGDGLCSVMLPKADELNEKLEAIKAARA